MYIVRSTLAVAFALVAVGCAGSRAALMTEQEIAAFGTKEYQAPMPKVFDAAVGALKAQGYQIATQSQEKGTIVTARKVIRTVAVGGSFSATAIDITRQYTLRLHDKRGATAVSAYPRVYQGEANLSEQKVWDLEGPVGERTLWSSLFRQIGELL